MRSFFMTGIACLAFCGAAEAKVPAVVTDLPATQSLVEQVMAGVGTPKQLLERGGNPHSYQMRPSEARALEQADLVIWIGPEMTPWLDHAIDASSKTRPDLELLHTEGTHQRHFAGDGDDDDEDEGAHADMHEPGHDHEHGHEHGHADANGLFLDPHAWLDPKNAETWLGSIADALSKQDPEHAAEYAKNAAAAQKNIAALDDKLTAELKPAKGKPFVVYHDAYGYFAEHYGLTDAGWVSPGDATDPGAAHLVELRGTLKDKGVVCAFSETGHDPKPMERLIEGTDVRMGEELDPAGLKIDPQPDLYQTLLSDLADTLTDCLDKK